MEPFSEMRDSYYVQPAPKMAQLVQLVQYNCYTHTKDINAPLSWLHIGRLLPTPCLGAIYHRYTLVWKCTQGDFSTLEEHLLTCLTCWHYQPTAPDMSLVYDQALLAELLLIFAGEYFHLAKVPKLKAKRMTQKNQATPQTSSVVSSFISNFQSEILRSSAH